MTPSLFEVQSNTIENNDVYTLAIKPLEQSIEMLPGQFNLLQSPNIGQSAISVSQQKDDIIYHTIRAVGQVTQSLRKLQKGDALLLTGPFGQSWPIGDIKKDPLLLIAGGIGLAPLKPVIQYAIAHQLDLSVIYGARSSDDLIFQEELKTWAQQINLFITVDKPTKNWPHHVGVVTPLIAKALSSANTKVFMCGPEVMMRFCLYTLEDLKVPRENIYLSMERNMQCGIGLCGHCQWGPFFICKDGPVMNYAKIVSFFHKNEL